MWDEFIDILGRHPILNLCFEITSVTNNCMKKPSSEHLYLAVILKFVSISRIHNQGNNLYVH